MVEVSKRYRLGEYRTSLGEVLADLGARMRSRAQPSSGDLWALRNVSLEVAEGEAVGIVGRNGAGKSTLLKVLTRITEPTAGVARTRGRVGVAARGRHRLPPRAHRARERVPQRRHPRHDRREIARAASTRSSSSPASSGSSTRRSSATRPACTCGSPSPSPPTSTPDILLVDEVLAVGDAEFQRKCLGQDGRRRARAAARSCSSATTSTPSSACAARASGSTAGRSSPTGPPPRSSTATSAPRSSSTRPARSRPNRARRCASSTCGCAMPPVDRAPCCLETVVSRFELAFVLER